MLLGQYTRCAYAAGAADPRGDALAALLGALPAELPVLAGLPVGHEPQSDPLPLGGQVTLDLDTGLARLAALPWST